MNRHTSSAYALDHIEWDRKSAHQSGHKDSTEIPTAETYTPPDIEESAEWIATLLAEHDVTADYSPASLPALDRFMARSVSAQLPGSHDFFAADLSRRTFAIGAYVGEVIRRTSGGEWLVDESDPLVEINIALRLPDGSECQPMRRVLDRLNNGPGSSFASFAAEQGLEIPDAVTEETSAQAASADDFDVRGFVMLWHTPSGITTTPEYHFAADTTACVNLLGYFTFLESKTIPSLKAINALTQEDGVVLPDSHSHGETRSQMGIFFDPDLAPDYWRLVDDNGQLYIEMGSNRLKEFKNAVTTIFLGRDTPVVGAAGEQLQLWPKARTEEPEEADPTPSPEPESD